MSAGALCANCDGPIIEMGGVWRHQVGGNTPLLTRWCLDSAGNYIWPTRHAVPNRADNNYSVKLDQDSE